MSKYLTVEKNDLAAVFISLRWHSEFGGVGGELIYFYFFFYLYCMKKTNKQNGPVRNWNHQNVRSRIFQAFYHKIEYHKSPKEGLVLLRLEILEMENLCNRDARGFSSTLILTLC